MAAAFFADTPFWIALSSKRDQYHARAVAWSEHLVETRAGEFIESAVKLYESRPDKSWSLTDCFSFVVMEQRQVTCALSTDHHFQQAGARLVLVEDPPDS